MHAACLKSAADGPRAGRYTDFSGPRGRLQKSLKKGGTPPRGAICGPPPPNLYLYIFFRRATTSPKVMFFNPVPILGLKKHHFEAPTGTRKKIIEVQDKKHAKKGYPPPLEVILGHFGHYGGFPVKTVCTPDFKGNPSQQRKRYTTHRGSSQRPRGSILKSLRV